MEWGEIFDSIALIQMAIASGDLCFANGTLTWHPSYFRHKINNNFKFSQIPTHFLEKLRTKVSAKPNISIFCNDWRVEANKTYILCHFPIIFVFPINTFTKSVMSEEYMSYVKFCELTTLKTIY